MCLYSVKQNIEGDANLHHPPSPAIGIKAQRGASITGGKDGVIIILTTSTIPSIFPMEHLCHGDTLQRPFTI